MTWGEPAQRGEVAKQNNFTIYTNKSYNQT